MRNNIKSIRERLSLSQAAFAVAIGVTQGNVSHYEMQRQEVPPEIARRVIAYAASAGLTLSFDDIYLSVEVSAGDTAPEPHQEAA